MDVCCTKWWWWWQDMVSSVILYLGTRVRCIIHYWYCDMCHGDEGPSGVILHVAGGLRLSVVSLNW